ncbi:hypothetical protein ACOSP7_012328 [Xanthoceras sorbifolium]
MQEINLEVVFLSKTISDVFHIEVLRVKLGFVEKLVVERSSRSEGLCLFWKDTVDVSLLSFGKFHIDAQVTSHQNKVWHLTGFYGNLNVAQQGLSWTLLQRLHGLSTMLWLCGEDFNEILHDSGKSRGCLRPPNLINNFRSGLDFCDLKDSGYSGPDFTWCNKTEGQDLIQERLDRCVCNLNWNNLFPFPSVKHLSYWRSNHRPVMLEVLDSPMLNNSPSAKRNRRFHFETCSAEAKDCKAVIKDS